MSYVESWEVLEEDADGALSALRSVGLLYGLAEEMDVNPDSLQRSE